MRQFGSRLRPVSDATTVQVRGGEVLLSDGPFAETKEQMGGFDLIECKDLDEAIEVASKHPGWRWPKARPRAWSWSWPPQSARAGHHRRRAPVSRPTAGGDGVETRR